METIPKVKLPTPYKIKNKLTTLNKIGKEKISDFLGSLEVETMFYLYLFKKYKSDCFLYSQTAKLRLLGMSIAIKKKYDDYHPNEIKSIDTQFTELASALIDCIKRGTNIIIIPVQLVLPDGGAHANVLIYRKNLNQIEHFEPHGKKFSTNDNNTNKVILDWMKNFVFKINRNLSTLGTKQIKFIESTDICPYIHGLQNLESSSDIIKIKDVEPGGYCSAWSMFFTELCLKNPNIPSSELMNYIFNFLENMSVREKMAYLRSIIRGYASFINEKIEKYFSLFTESGLTIKKIKTFNSNKIRELHTILEFLITVEIDSVTNPSQIDETVAEIQKRLDKYYEAKITKADIVKRLEIAKFVYEKYKNFKVSEPTESISSHIEKSKPKQNIVIKKEPVEIKKEPVEIEKELLGMPVKVCPEGKEINPKTGRCVKSKTQKIKKIEKIKSPKQKVLEPEIKMRKECPEGKELNAKTGRCIKIKTQKVKKIKMTKPKVKTVKQIVVYKSAPIPEPVKILEPVLETVKLEPEPVKLALKKSSFEFDESPPEKPKKLKRIKKGPLTVKLQPEIKMNKICPEGKELNVKTGRCNKIKTKKVKIPKVKTLKVKKEKKIKQKTPKTCPEGKELNVKTGRCVKVKTQKIKIK